MPSTLTLVSKRLFDIVSSLVGIVLLSPFFIIISAVIAITSPGPVFFRQVRIGRHGKPFKILKFRTMVVNAEKLGKQITVGADSRITPIGKFLRASKLDELPQLLNILAGSMSVVGPRPEVPRFVELYTEEERRILVVRPGLTDYASIEYRSESDVLAHATDPEYTYIHEIMPHKLELNKRYIEEMSLFTDLKIIFRTIWAVMH